MARAWKRRELRALCSDMSDRLFNACYRQLLNWMLGAIDTPDLEGAKGWMEQIASDKVNNPKSSFYIHGE